MCALATASKTVAMASVVWAWSSPSFPRSGVAGEAAEVVRPVLFSDLFSPAGRGGEGRWRSVWELWFLVVLLLFFVGASPAGRGGEGRGLLELQGGWWLRLAGEAVPAVKRWPFVPGLLLRSAGAGSGAGGEVSGGLCRSGSCPVRLDLTAVRRICWRWTPSGSWDLVLFVEFHRLLFFLRLRLRDGCGRWDTSGNGHIRRLPVRTHQGKACSGRSGSGGAPSARPGGGRRSSP